MALSALDDKTAEPTPADLQAVLGRSHALWQRLVAHLEAEYPPLAASWNHSGAKYGWTLRLRRKKRTILYLTPGRRHFLVGIVFGEKAVADVRTRQLPAEVMALIDEAPRYAEGRGFRMEVRFKKDLEAVQELAAVKMAN